MAVASDRASTVRKLIELAMTHVATFAFPLVFAVICGRTLGIHDYGIVSFYAALAAFLGMVIEFGFDWYGIREVARHQGDPAGVHRILWNITAAKLLLCAGVVGVAGGALWQLRAHAEWPLMLASSAYLVGFAFDAGWYVRALEQTRLLLLITSGVRLVGIVVLLFGARTPEELLYGDEFRAFADAHPNFRFVPCFSRELPQAGSPQAHADVRHGYVQNFLAEFSPDAQDDIAYLCGNPNMVDTTFEALKEFGLSIQHIRREKYVSSK